MANFEFSIHPENWLNLIFSQKLVEFVSDEPLIIPSYEAEQKTWNAKP